MEPPPPPPPDWPAAPTALPAMLTAPEAMLLATPMATVPPDVPPRAAVAGTISLSRAGRAKTARISMPMPAMTWSRFLVSWVIEVAE
ncbi:hypothetical protein [Streptomyces caniscabiei]|uniref:hypothetical protein n=1 Tax=Streptomyces caniscabiei TaxID=2746961 RepID=UPI0023DB154E|nr:hypothetical protein [Streptomyces caniscabiei]WEO24904.1 hypothetical protein IHE65_17895 [Streptomyces caniscabiei]